jgi:hypothetical protein
MPSFEKSLSDQQIWQVSEFLAKADKVPESVLKVLKDEQPGRK